jgi:asparagine synthase (glutamine-hydrolysing)
MSGICGQFNLDNATVAQADLRAMTSMLELRGPDRTKRWLDGPFGLGHTLLATTPELQFEHQPFTHAESECVITADVRLDNREELLDAFRRLADRNSTGDAELILLAYLKWGEDCVDRLLGDFAFSIADPRERKLFCARDHFGMRPLYYHHAPGRFFLFS